jgi:hypothetical protein
MLVVVVDVLPWVTPSALRDVEQRCPRQVALDYTDDGFSDPVNRGRLRDAFLDAARAAHGSGGLPRADAFRSPDALEPEEQRVFEHAARWYLALYGDRSVTLHLHDCDRPTERGGIRVGGWVDLTVEHEDGTKELRQIDLWRSRAPRDDPMELESVWMAALRLRPWVGDGALVVSWADLVGGAHCERVVQLGEELEPLRERFETRLGALRSRADPLRPVPGGGCARCNHLVRCPAHPGALPVRTPRGDPRPGVFRLTPTSFDTWTRCRRDWWLAMLSVPASDDTGFPDHGQLLHDILRLVHEQGSCHDAAHLSDVLDSHGASDRLRDEVARHVERCPSPAEALGHELDMAQFFAARPALHSFLVTARLDAVWQHGDVLDARDYKTGRVRTARVADDARAWIQALSLMGVAQGRGLRIRLRYEHLAAEIDEEPEPWEPDAEELAGLEARVRAAVVEMRDERDFSGVADAEVCGWCRYRSICRDSAAPGEAQWPEVFPDEAPPVEVLDRAP